MASFALLVVALFVYTWLLIGGSDVVDVDKGKTRRKGASSNVDVDKDTAYRRGQRALERGQYDTASDWFWVAWIKGGHKGGSFWTNEEVFHKFLQCYSSRGIVDEGYLRIAQKLVQDNDIHGATAVIGRALQANPNNAAAIAIAKSLNIFDAADSSETQSKHQETPTIDNSIADKPWRRSHVTASGVDGDSGPYYKSDELVIILRGHIRDAFDDDQLYNFLLLLAQSLKLRLYIHTWSQVSSGQSWRKVEANTTAISADVIKGYLRELSANVTELIIENDHDTLPLIGSVKGKLFNTPMPVVGWKRMWYGIHRIMEHVVSNEPSTQLLLNMRWDIFSNFNYFTPEQLLGKLVPLFQRTEPLEGNAFIPTRDLLLGVDNAIFGDPEIMMHLVKRFHRDLDELRKVYSSFKHHELSVYYENDRLFGITSP